MKSPTICRDRFSEVSNDRCAPGDTPVRPQRAAVFGHAEFALQGDSTRVVSLGSRAPLQLLAPRAGSDVGWLVMGSLGGGLLGGDHIKVDLHVQQGAGAYVTTQASTKIFKSGGCGAVRQSLDALIAPDASMLLAPDPVVCFAQSDYQQEQKFYLHAGSSLLAVDWFTSGRWQCGERWNFARYISRQSVYVNGDPILLDALELDNTVSHISRTVGFNVVNALATVICLGPRFAGAALALLQRLHNTPIQTKDSVMFGISELADGFLLRVGGDSAENVGRFLQKELVSAAAAMGVELWQRKW